MLALVRRLSATATVVLVACSSSQISPVTTGLTGTMMRGPVTPVCRVDVPCSAPMTGNFSIVQGRKTVAAFRTDSIGRFTVMLPPGTYTIIPSDAAMMGPMRQGKTVIIAARGMTAVRIEFDTGLR